MGSAIILASTSPYRRELLARLGLPFAAVPPGVEERRLPGEPPREMVRRLAQEKAMAVHARHPGAIVIGSDQAVVLEGEVMGKPGGHARAFEQLRRASGKRLEVLTGLCVAGPQGISSDVVPFRVALRALSDAAIEAYLRKERPYDCAGGIRSEGLGIALIEGMEGEDPTALIGLPLIRLVEMLERQNVRLL